MKAGKIIALVTAAMLTVSSAHAAGTPYAERLHELMGLPITNSIITSWVVSLFIIVIVRLMVGRPTLVPSRGQSVVEVMMEQIGEIMEPIVGKHMIRPTFWLLAGLFTYIMIHNWSGLIPFVGTIGHMEGGHFVPYVRPANADLNMTLALALVSMAAWLFYILKYAGPKMVIKDIFGNKANKDDVPAPVYFGLTFIFIGVGLIEVISIIFRPVSLSFRLYGNVFGGENLLANMTSLGVGMMDYILPILLPLPFYFLELLIGLIQALVFTLLVAVYIGLICNHEGGEGEHH